MWTYQESKPYAEKVGGRIVGSVKTKGKSEHDLDILVNEYNQGISDILNRMNFTYVGSQTVSPDEIRRSRKFGRNSEFWLRNHRFENLNDQRVIEIWNVEKEKMNESVNHESYRYNEYKWMKTMSGFGYPVDVYHGSVHLGILLANADGYSIAAVSGPLKQIQIKQGPKNMFKSKEIAAQVLHHAWKTERHGQEYKEN